MLNGSGPFAAPLPWQHGGKGARFAETCRFDGVQRTPEDIATEMRGLYPGRKPRDGSMGEGALDLSKEEAEDRWGT
jgi:hypothetical protein